MTTRDILSIDDFPPGQVVNATPILMGERLHALLVFAELDIGNADSVAALRAEWAAVDAYDVTRAVWRITPDEVDKRRPAEYGATFEASFSRAWPEHADEVATALLYGSAIVAFAHIRVPASLAPGAELIVRFPFAVGVA